MADYVLARPHIMRLLSPRIVAERLGILRSVGSNRARALAALPGTACGLCRRSNTPVGEIGNSEEGRAAKSRGEGHGYRS